MDYVKQYYVSFDPAASWWPDRWLANRAYKAYPLFELGGDTQQADANRRAYAAQELQVLLRVVLVLRILIYLACMGAVAFRILTT